MATTRKKTAKKTTKKAAKKTTKTAAPTASGATRPKFKASAAANRAMTKRQSIYHTLQQGTNTLRLVPRYDDEGLAQGAIFVLQRLHYDVNSGFPSLEDSERKVAPACLQEHGDGNCYICNFVEWCKTQGVDERLVELGEEMYATKQLQAQAWLLDPTSKQWYGPRIVKIPNGVATDLTDLISVAEDNDMPVFCDPDEGQGVAITRTGQGRYGTKYSVHATGKIQSMDDIDPDWWNKCIKDLPAKLDMKVYDIDQQKEMLVNAHPDLPWDLIEKEIG